MRLLLPLGLSLGLLSSGCDTKASFESDSGSSEVLTSGDRPDLHVSPTDLEELAQPEALLELAHLGRRRVDIYSADGVHTAFIERVATDGHGRFAVEPTEALTPLTTDFETFKLRQISRQGFIFRHRDFAIRDLELFRKHWTLEELEATERVAGRRCDKFLARRSRASNAPHYEVSIDSMGIVMAYRELSAADEVISEVRYLSFNSAPEQQVLDEVFWYEESIDETFELDWTQELEPQLPELDGMRIFQPRWLPSGYELRRATRDAINGTHWIRLKYTDGVELLFFGIDLPDYVSGKGTRGIDPPLAPRPHTPDRVMLFDAGRAAAVQGTLRDREIMAIGKVSGELMLDIVESSLPAAEAFH